MSHRKYALVVRGGWPGNHPLQATDAFIPFLESNSFTVQIEDSQEVCADAATMSGVDPILQSAMRSCR